MSDRCTHARQRDPLDDEDKILPCAVRSCVSGHPKNTVSTSRPLVVTSLESGSHELVCWSRRIRAKGDRSQVVWVEE